VRTDRGAYILKVLERESVDETDFQSTGDALTQKLLSQKRNETFAAWFTDLKENSDILDNRHQFYSNF
jgi:parvulin-like peptidyl-prolyl isomerase